MGDFSTMIESRVHSLETQIMETLGDADSNVKQQIGEMFHSQDVVDPFSGLKTEHMQKIFFREEFHLVVCIYMHACTRTHVYVYGNIRLSIE